MIALVPITLVSDPAKRRINAHASGSIALADVERHLDEEQRLGGLAYAELIDARDATAVLSSADVRQIVDQLRWLAKDHTLGPAAVVVSNDVTYGMLRMLEILIEDVCLVRPFRDAAEARAWLDDVARGV